VNAGRYGIAMRGAACAALVACAVVACGDRLPHPAYSPQPTSALSEVTFPPPPARAEWVPARPSEDAVWLDGEWLWRRRQWAWNPGRWVVAPQGTTYAPWTSVRSEDGTLFYAPGAWHDAKGEVIADPKPLAVAKAASRVLFDAEGDVERAGRTVRPDKAQRPDGGS
jgi:hypothetical protein